MSTGFSCLADQAMKTGRHFHVINWNDVKIITKDNSDLCVI